MTYLIFAAAATVIPGATLTYDVLKDALTALGSGDRKISIGIDNESGFDWERPTHYFYSGTSEKNLPYHLKSGKLNLAFFGPL